MRFYSHRWISATRKPHKCWWCGEVIPVGARAHYAAGMNYDSEFWQGHTHPECEAAVSKSDYDDEGFDEHVHARGRMDDDRTAPPEFSADYKGEKL